MYLTVGLKVPWKVTKCENSLLHHILRHQLVTSFLNDQNIANNYRPNQGKRLTNNYKRDVDTEKHQGIEMKPMLAQTDRVEIGRKPDRH